MSEPYEAARAASQEAYELSLFEEADAWFEYLEATSGRSGARYAEVEPWAWARLGNRLRDVYTRRSRLQLSESKSA